MKSENVSPSAGQHWRKNSTGERDIIESVNPRGSVKWFGVLDTTFNKYLHRHWTFIPRSDLETLAVNPDAWKDNKHDKALIGLCEGIPKFSNCFELLDGLVHWYTKDEWVIERIRLGLIDKTRWKLVGGKWELEK